MKTNAEVINESMEYKEYISTTLLFKIITQYINMMEKY